MFIACLALQSGSERFQISHTDSKLRLSHSRSCPGDLLLSCVQRILPQNKVTKPFNNSIHRPKGSVNSVISTLPSLPSFPVLPSIRSSSNSPSAGQIRRKRAIQNLSYHPIHEVLHIIYNNSVISPLPSKSTIRLRPQHFLNPIHRIICIQIC